MLLVYRRKAAGIILKRFDYFNKKQRLVPRMQRYGKKCRVQVSCYKTFGVVFKLLIVLQSILNYGYAATHILNFVINTILSVTYLIARRLLRLAS